MHVRALVLWDYANECLCPINHWSWRNITCVKPLVAIRLQRIGANAFKGDWKATSCTEWIYPQWSYNASNNCADIHVSAMSAMDPKEITHKCKCTCSTLINWDTRCSLSALCGVWDTSAAILTCAWVWWRLLPPLAIVAPPLLAPPPPPPPPPPRVWPVPEKAFTEAVADGLFTSHLTLWCSSADDEPADLCWLPAAARRVSSLWWGVRGPTGMCSVPRHTSKRSAFLLNRKMIFFISWNCRCMLSVSVFP